MREIIKLGLTLLLICTISALALSMTYSVTIDKIVEQRNIASEESRKAILPDAESFKPVDENKLNEIVKFNDKVVEVYEGYAGGAVVGYAIKTLPSGYGGSLEVITGIKLDGNISGVRVGNHQETPGLGANATLPSFYTQYEGKSIDKELEVVKSEPSNENEIEAISGATITSNAVTTGVNYAIEAFNVIVGK